ncbi:MAG: hypothetical protein HY824_10085 [Acidobacteria bacterium]|nr:hypothetical protein [Acidobacteriota bacterium]
MQKQGIRLFLAVLAGVALAAAASTPALAHHGWGGNADEESTLTGTLAAPVSLAGPHATFKLKTADGQVWDITLAPPPRAAAAGLKEGIIPMGAPVTVRGHRNKTANRFEMKTESVIWNNRTFAVYADRH